MSDQVITSHLPIIIVTGFLGAGKTSFVSQLLKLEDLSNSAVIINEFGAIGLDHILVESLNEQIFDLPDGCLCCNSSSALIEKLLTLSIDNLSGKINIDRVILETSGISDTTNLVRLLWNNTQIGASFHLSGIITIVSAIEWNDSKSHFLEVESQLAISDAVIITKTDLLPKASKDTDLAHLLTEIEMISAGSDKYIMPLSPTQIRNIIRCEKNTFIPPATVDTPTHNTDIYNTCTLSLSRPISIQAISLFLDIVTSRHGDKLLRIKGLVFTIEHPAKPMIIQVVKSTVTPFSWLSDWPDSPQTQIVLIHTHLDNSPFTNLFNSVTDIPAIDQPDKIALSDNPLSITGQGKFKSS